MQRFFFDGEIISDNGFSVTGEKYDHICKVLRMSVGERVVFCDGVTDRVCRITSIDKSSVVFEIEDAFKNSTEPKTRITVFQCLPKGEKMDEMIKRCVQFGVSEIVPVLSKRCVARPDKKTYSKKVERWNKIALSSAMQSMRGIVPKVREIIDYGEAVRQMQMMEHAFVCYEGERELRFDNSMVGNQVAFLIGPEGGLDGSEAQLATESGIKCVSLGRRILRTEDAAAFLIPIILFASRDL